MSLEEFEDMWTEDRQHFSLVKPLQGRAGSNYAIIDRRTRTMVLIEDEEVMHEVIERMLKAGVEVVDDIPR